MNSVISTLEILTSILSIVCMLESLWFAHKHQDYSRAAYYMAFAAVLQI